LELILHFLPSGYCVPIFSNIGELMALYCLYYI
jgi:hypothetical protein